MQVVATLPANPTKEKIMYEVVLSKPQSSEPAINILGQLNEELEAMRKQRAKVYRTYAPQHEKREYVFVTTSKDTLQTSSHVVPNVQLVMYHKSYE